MLVAWRSGRAGLRQSLEQLALEILVNSDNVRLEHIAFEMLHISKANARRLRRLTAQTNCAYAFATGACSRNSRSNLKMNLL